MEDVMRNLPRSHRTLCLLLPALLLSACADSTVPADTIVGSVTNTGCNTSSTGHYPWYGSVGPDPLCLQQAKGYQPQKILPENPPRPQGELSDSGKILTVLYDRSLSYCLYYKNQNHRADSVLSNGTNFGDAAVALAAPIAAFAAGANASVTALVGGVAGVFGSQLKTALDGEIPDSSSDFGQTMSSMKTFYTAYKDDPRLVDDSRGTDAQTALQEFEIAMTQTCFSGGGGDKSKSGDDSPSGGGGHAHGQ
jgi:hypothetical protein